MFGLLLAKKGGLRLAGNMLLTIFWATTMRAPNLTFDKSEAVEPVTLTDNWAALPSRVELEDMTPREYAIKIS